MLAVLCGFRGLSPCPTAFLPLGSYLRSVLDPKDKVGKVTSGSHADKSLLLKNTWPMSWWDPPCCCLTAPCHMLSVRATVAEVSPGFVLPSAAAGVPWACGCVQVDWDAKKQERGRGESSAELPVICHPRFQFKLLSQLSSSSDDLWLGCRVFACHCVWHEGHTLLLLPFLVE